MEAVDCITTKSSKQTNEQNIQGWESTQSMGSLMSKDWLVAWKNLVWWMFFCNTILVVWILGTHLHWIETYEMLQCFVEEIGSRRHVFSLGKSSSRRRVTVVHWLYTNHSLKLTSVFTILLRCNSCRGQKKRPGF